MWSSHLSAHPGSTVFKHENAKFYMFYGFKHKIREEVLTELCAVQPKNTRDILKHDTFAEAVIFTRPSHKLKGSAQKKVTSLIPLHNLRVHITYNYQ